MLDTYTPVAKEYRRVLETDDLKSIIVNPPEEVSDGPFTSTETHPSVTSTSESCTSFTHMQCTIMKNIKKTSLPHKKIISPVQHQQPIVRNGLQPSTATSASLILAVKGSKPSTTCIPQKNDTGRSKSMCIEIKVLPTDKRYILLTDWADIKVNVQKTGTIRAHQEHESFLTIVNEKCI